MNRIRVIFLWGLAIFFFLLMGGCHKDKNTRVAGSFSYPLTVKDDSGYVLKVTKVPERIVSLTPSNTEILFALGLGDRLVGVTTYCDYPLEAKKKPKVGSLKANVEQVVALKPDLVVAKWTLNKDAVVALRKLDIPVLCVEPESVDSVYKAIRIIARITGTKETGEEIIQKIEAKLSMVEEKLRSLDPGKRLNVFIEVGADPLFTAGKGTYVDELVTLAGGVNVAADVKGYQMYSSESVVEKNPDVILAADSYYVNVKDAIKKRPGWEQIRAVQGNRVIDYLDSNLINRCGPRVAEAVEAIACALYPELFHAKD